MSDKVSRLFSSPAYLGPEPETVTVLDAEGEEIHIDVRPPKVDMLVKNLSDPEKPTKKVLEIPMERILLECCFDPDTNKPFFGPEHIESIEQSSAHDGGILFEIRRAFSRVRRKEAERTDEEIVGN